jgi:hypothetical protein
MNRLYAHLLTEGVGTFHSQPPPAFVRRPEKHDCRNRGYQWNMLMPPSTPSGIDDRRVAETDRRISPRMRTLKGAKIVWPTAAPVTCIVRNLSEIGARLEVHCPVPRTFELVFDGDQSRRACYMVWQKANQIGVKFK